MAVNSSRHLDEYGRPIIVSRRPTELASYRSMNTSPSIDRQDGVALWRRIAESLRSSIESGDHTAGGRLPTEAVLAGTFSVNRHTVRRALEALERDGLIRIEQGRGTFVTEDAMDYVVGPRTRFSEWIRRNNREPSGQALQLREIAADAAVASAFGMPEGQSVVLFERLGFADGKPVSLGRHHFRDLRMLAALRETDSITAAFQTIGIADYRRLSSRVSARMPTATEAERLRMPRGRPVLIAENINVGPDGAVVEFTVGCYPTPRVQIVFEP